MNIKYKFYRLIIRLKWRINKNLYPEPELNLIQTKAVALYYLYLRDKESQVSCSFLSLKRHIENDRVLIILGPGLQDSIITVVDENINNVINCFEVLIPRIKFQQMSKAVDIEMERRLKSAEWSKKDAITKDLDKLIDIAITKEK